MFRVVLLEQLTVEFLTGSNSALFTFRKNIFLQKKYLVNLTYYILYPNPINRSHFVVFVNEICRYIKINLLPFHEHAGLHIY